MLSIVLHPQFLYPWEQFCHAMRHLPETWMAQLRSIAPGHPSPERHTKTVKIPCEKTICGEESFLGTTQMGRLNLRVEYRSRVGFGSNATGHRQTTSSLQTRHRISAKITSITCLASPDDTSWSPPACKNFADQPFQFTVIKGGSCLTQGRLAEILPQELLVQIRFLPGPRRLITHNLTTQMQEFGHTMPHLWHVTCHPCVSWKKPRRWPFRIPAWHTLVPTLV